MTGTWGDWENELGADIASRIGERFDWAEFVSGAPVTRTIEDAEVVYAGAGGFLEAVHVDEPQTFEVAGPVLHRLALDALVPYPPICDLVGFQFASKIEPGVPWGDREKLLDHAVENLIGQIAARVDRVAGAVSEVPQLVVRVPVAVRLLDERHTPYRHCQGRVEIGVYAVIPDTTG